MITDFGRFTRQLRVDNHELGRHMARKLGVKSTHLWAVEAGRKKIPSEWYKKIVEGYNLTEKQIMELAKITGLNNVKRALLGDEAANTTKGWTKIFATVE